MKTLKTTAISLITWACFACYIFAGDITVQNLNDAGDNGYGIFDSEGTRYSTSGTATIRFGVSSLSDANIVNNFNSGNLSAIDSSFTNFDGTFGMIIDDGIFQDGQSATTTPFAGQQMTLWISSESSFTSTSSEQLIYRFDQTFGAEPFASKALLGTDSGTLLVGQFGNYSHDFSGSMPPTPLPGFNTVAAVPEPSLYAVLSSLAVMLLYLRRKRSVI